MGYGTQAPKVVETVIRTKEYNKKREDRKEFIVRRNRIQRLQWEQEVDRSFPFYEIHGNYSQIDFQNMTVDFLKSNFIQINSIVNMVMDRLLITNADVLTKGNQTLDVFSGSSIPAPQAYKKMYDFLSRNTGKKSFTCLEWIHSYQSLFQKTVLHTQKMVKRKVTQYFYDRISAQKKYQEKEIWEMKWVEIRGAENIERELIKIASRFASYIKHKERGKKDRRAIASPGMILRMYLYVIEEFHLELGKVLPGSTISIGGERKKAKIIDQIHSTLQGAIYVEHLIQMTEDASKWNECLAPSAFATMHRILFDPEVRRFLEKEFFLEIQISHLQMTFFQLQREPVYLCKI